MQLKCDVTVLFSTYLLFLERRRLDTSPAEFINPILELEPAKCASALSPVKLTLGERYHLVECKVKLEELKLIKGL